MEARIKNYIRTHRKRHSLTQKDVAFLLGLDSSQVVSRYEKNIRLPSLKVILATSILFDTPPGDLFPVIRRDVETLLITRAQSLANKYQHSRSPLIMHKRDFLLAVLERLEVRDN